MTDTAQTPLSTLRDSIVPFLGFFNGPIWARNGDPGIANLAVGNPQEMPLAAMSTPFESGSSHSRPTGSPTS
jgi:hypothetical protein